MTLYAHFSAATTTTTTTTTSASLLRAIKSKPLCIPTSSSPPPPPPPAAAAACAAPPHDARQRQRLVVILGATGSGKTRLSLDLASTLSAQIINADKMQLYKGLEITTNQIPAPRRRGVPHHLLGQLDPSAELTPSAYREAAHSLITQLSAHNTLPILVGGSNSFIHALLSPSFDPSRDVFSSSSPHPISPHPRYDCCFLWVDVSPPVLRRYLRRRVDDMMREGMLDELAEFFAAGGTPALRKAIGVEEFSDYFNRRRQNQEQNEKQQAEEVEEYDVAVRKVKDNTCLLARRQMGKIQRFIDAGWGLGRVDSTDVLWEAMQGLDSSSSGEPEQGDGDGLWERRVLDPSLEMVKLWLSAQPIINQ